MRATIETSTKTQCVCACAVYIIRMCTEKYVQQIQKPIKFITFWLYSLLTVVSAKMWLLKIFDVRCVCVVRMSTAHHQCWCVNIFLLLNEGMLAFWQFIIASCLYHYYHAYQELPRKHSKFCSTASLENHQWVRLSFVQLLGTSLYVYLWKIKSNFKSSKMK